MNSRRWICGEVWMDILPSFDHAQLGLKMALLSYRFDALIYAYFDGKTTELTLWKTIIICKDEGPKAQLCEWIDVGKFVAFLFPDRPLPNKICFKDLQINYIDHSVVEFVRSNKHIWDRSGTELELYVDSDETENDDVQRFWDVFASELWPVFATNIHHLSISGRDPLDNLRRRTSPTILTDLDQLNSMFSNFLFPDGIADDWPNTTISVGQALSKWLHTPSKNGKQCFARILTKLEPPIGSTVLRRHLPMPPIPLLFATEFSLQCLKHQLIHLNR